MLRLFAVLLALLLSSFGVQAKKNPIVIQALPPGPTVVMAVSANSSPGYVAPASIWVSVEAYDSTEEVTELRLYKNNVLVSTVYDWILETSIDNLAAGSYVIKVVATNGGGGSSSKSQTVTITAPTNQPPVITLNAPSGGPFIAPATVVWTSSASDSDGSINRVEYYANGTHIGTATSSPYQLTPTNVSAGTYSVVAKAVDNTGAVTTSNAVSVTVDPTTVRGVIDDLSLVSNEYRLTGWACSSGRNQSIDVHMYLGGPAGSGVWGGSYTANVGSELAVANACQAGGTNYRFIIPVTAQMRADHAGKKVYIHGISPEGQPNLLINGSGVFAVPALQLPSVTVSRRYVYDSYQQLCKVIEPETGSTVMQYDGAGNLAWSASGLNLPDQNACNRDEAWASNRAVLRDYDARNRIKALSFPDRNGDQDWEYYADGLPKQITTYNDGGNNHVINAYSYNKRRLLTGESKAQSNWYAWGLGYGYDANGNLANQIYPDGINVDYAPNALGQPTRAGSYASGVSYYPNGAVKQFAYGNGVVHAMTQNARQLPARSTDAGAIDFTFGYDANANVTTIRDVNAVQYAYSGNRDMEYDGLDRLTYAHLHWWQINNYSYDSLDNIRAHSLFNGSTTLTKNYYYDAANRLTNIQDGSGASIVGLGYDVQGNLQNKNGQSYSFDYGNRLRSVPGKEGYRYDGHGRRVLAWKPDAGSILSQYGQSGQLLAQEDQRKSGTQFDEYIYLGGSLVATRERNYATGAVSTKYQHTDALGSPVAVTNEAGQVIDRTNYEPYGAAINKPDYQGPGYTGHVMDAATGLTYMQQRYYDPGLGIFTSVDPVQANPNTGAKFCRYCYGNNNPYKFTDPDGRDGIAFYTQPQYQMAQPSPEGAGFVADFIPVIGDIKAGVEAFQNPTFANIAAAAVGVLGPVGDVAGKAIKGADNVADAAKGALPKAGTGKGSVSPSDRDPKRAFSKNERASGLGKQDGNCANCGKQTALGKSDAHHVQRHADGGQTKPENMAVVCKDCHKELHKP